MANNGDVIFGYLTSDIGKDYRTGTTLQPHAIRNNSVDTPMKLNRMIRRVMVRSLVRHGKSLDLDLSVTLSLILI